jgi:hypothetical protein
MPPPLPDQFLFLFTREALDSPLAFHCSSTIWLGLEIDHLYREPAASVARGGSVVVLFQASLRIGRPAGIESPIRAFENVTIKRHGCYFRFLREPIRVSNTEGTSERSGFATSDQSAEKRSAIQR